MCDKLGLGRCVVISAQAVVISAQPQRPSLADQVQVAEVYACALITKSLFAARLDRQGTLSLRRWVGGWLSQTESGCECVCVGRVGMAGADAPFGGVGVSV